MLSFQAAYAAPILMMSQNRASSLDRMQASADYDINRKAEAEITEILTLLRTISDRLGASADRTPGPDDRP
jgi:uncharacterized membrane protein